MNESVWADSLAGPADRSVAQSLTDCGPASSSTAWSAPIVNDGASLTAVTVMVNVCSALVSSPPFAVPPSSSAWTPIVAVPFALARRRVAQRVRRPTRLAARGEQRRLEFELITNDTVWPDSSAGPSLTAVARPGHRLRAGVLEVATGCCPW